jgi:hypothetical protein
MTPRNGRPAPTAHAICAASPYAATARLNSALRRSWTFFGA